MNALTQAQRVFADSSRWNAAMAKTVATRTLNNRKFVEDDLRSNPWLDLVAEHYARSYNGTFDYMLQMRDSVRIGYKLSARQFAGILNCAIADWARSDRNLVPQAPAADDLPNVKDVVDSRYRVVQADGSSLAIRLAPSRKDKSERVLTYLGAGAEWTFAAYVRADGTVRLASSASNMRKSLKAALEVLVNSVREGDWLVHALAFSRMGSSCCFCGRDLDTLESIEMGYGPICADKYGLPWGQTSKPASVESAEAAVTAAPAPEEDQDAGATVTPETQPEATTQNVDSFLAGDLLDDREPTEDDPSVARGRQVTGQEPIGGLAAGIAQSKWKGHVEGTFESGRSILKKADKAPTLDERFGKSSYRPGRTYEEIFGDEDGEMVRR